MKPIAIDDVIPFGSAQVLNRKDLIARATECGMDPNDLPGFLAAMTGEGDTEAGRKRGADILANRDPHYITVFDEREAKIVEEARAGLRAILRLVNGSDEIVPRIVAGEIAAEHRYLQSGAVLALVKALRLLCERPEGSFDARNEWTRRLAEPLANLI